MQVLSLQIANSSAPLVSPSLTLAIEEAWPVFGLSVLGHCRNVEVQHRGLYGRGPAASVDIKDSS